MTQTDFYKREYLKDHYKSECFNSVRLGSAWIIKYIFHSLKGDVKSSQFLKSVSNYLKNSKITSLCYLSIGVYRPIRDEIEKIHISIFGNNEIEWFDPFMSEHSIDNDMFIYFDDHETNVALVKNK